MLDVAKFSRVARVEHTYSGPEGRDEAMANASSLD
jgi:hypothetical protein